MYFRLALLENSKIFERPEAITWMNFPNPAVESFNPSAADPEMKKFTPAQVYGVCWMESRLAEGGGFIGDECGMGKVCCTGTCGHIKG